MVNSLRFIISKALKTVVNIKKNLYMIFILNGLGLRCKLPINTFFCLKSILAGLEKVETTHLVETKIPTSETTNGRNDPVPVVSMDQLPLIFP